MKSPEFDEHIIFSPGLCCHVALGTYSRTCLKDAVVEINVRRHKLTNVAKIPKCQFDMNIKNRIITKYCFVSINTFQLVMIHLLLDMTNFSTTTNDAEMPKKGPQGLHLDYLKEHSN